MTMTHPAPDLSASPTPTAHVPPASSPDAANLISLALVVAVAVALLLLVVAQRAPESARAATGSAAARVVSPTAMRGIAVPEPTPAVIVEQPADPLRPGRKGLRLR